MNCTISAVGGRACDKRRCLAQNLIGASQLEILNAPAPSTAADHRSLGLLAVIDLGAPDPIAQRLSNELQGDTM